MQLPASNLRIKADRLHLRYYPYKPPDYRHTDKYLRLVITPIALCCTQQSRAPNIDRCTPEIWPLTLTPTFDLDPDLWRWPQGRVTVMSKHNCFAFDLDFWSTTLTYNPILAKVKVDSHTKNQGRRSNGSAVRAQTNRRTDGRYQVHHLPRFAVDNKVDRSPMNTLMSISQNANFWLILGSSIASILNIL